MSNAHDLHKGNFVKRKEKVFQKKTREDLPGGYIDNAQAFLAGTVATHTHASLARHVCYVFYQIDSIDPVAQYMGVIKYHTDSKTNLNKKVKFQPVSIFPRHSGSSRLPRRPRRRSCDISPMHPVLPVIPGVSIGPGVQPFHLHLFRG